MIEIIGSEQIVTPSDSIEPFYLDQPLRALLLTIAPLPLLSESIQVGSMMI